jgi:PPOX class probable F420-dependent enzyme
MAKGTTDQITESVAKLLQDKNFAFIATLMPDGSPQVTPTWVDAQDNIILINTAEARLKHKNISRDPRVAVSITDRNNPYNMVTIRGKVIERTNQGADEHIDKLAKKYLDVDKYPMKSSDEKRIIVKIKPEKIFHFPFSWDQVLGKK